jgi:hypothetical protein
MERRFEVLRRPKAKEVRREARRQGWRRTAPRGSGARGAAWAWTGGVSNGCRPVRRSAFPGGHGGESSHELMHVLTAAVGAGHPAFIHFGHVERLRKFLVAVLAMKHVLRHEQVPPRHMIAPNRMPGGAGTFDFRGERIPLAFQCINGRPSMNLRRFATRLCLRVAKRP